MFDIVYRDICEVVRETGVKDFFGDTLTKTTRHIECLKDVKKRYVRTDRGDELINLDVYYIRSSDIQLNDIIDGRVVRTVNNIKDITGEFIHVEVTF